MAYNVTSEWEDAHVRLGNYLPRPKEVTTEELEKLAIDVIDKYDPLDSKSLSQLKELEDDEDEDVIRAYEAKRMQELKDYSMMYKYGKLIELRKQDYVQEVNRAPKDVFVVLFLYQTYSKQSNILEKILEVLAVKFPTVKFLKIVATNCVQNFKDEDVPGLLIYQNEKLFKSLIPAHNFLGGKGMNWKSKLFIINQSF